MNRNAFHIIFFGSKAVIILDANCGSIDQTLVSVIIPCFNNAHYVREAVESALGQTHRAVEVIVVDDGSTDESASILRSFGGRIRLISQANAGACIARNNGLKVASGDWIKFLDADDVLMADCLSRQLSSVNSEGVLFGDSELIDESGCVISRSSHFEASKFAAGDRADLNLILNSLVLISTTLYPRSAFDRFGGFDPNVIRGQEHELHLRLYLNGVDFHYSPQVCFQYRQHSSPSRISTNRNKERHFDVLSNFQELIRLAREGARGGEFEINRMLLAEYSWRIGRRLLRGGDKSRADGFFSEALNLDGDRAIYGTALYKRVAKAFGPGVAEWMSFASSKMKRRAVEIER